MFRAAVLLAAAVATSHAADYAVLIAGSNGYDNYRHQADVCHAFQILRAGGYPRENIILMSYDDVAFSSLNPFRGKLFNQPSEGRGVDVREGCDPDYKGWNVTVENFLAVLRGDSGVTNGLPVLRTGPHDNVFVNFVDHGGVGLVAFPNGEVLHAQQLQSTLLDMQSKGKFAKLVFYLEACESGSMFTTLPTNVSIYTTTAANAGEPSWGTYCPPNDDVADKDMGTCLGDLYSVNWMANAQGTNLTHETLEKQFLIVKNMTTQSHVMQYGNLSLSALPAATFEGKGDVVGNFSLPASSSSVSSRDVPLHLAYHRYLRSGRKADLSALEAEIAARKEADERFASILGTYPPHETSYTLDAPTLSCVETVHEAVVAHCGGYSDYSLKYSYVAADLCGYTGGDAAGVAANVAKVCGAAGSV